MPPLTPDQRRAYFQVKTLGQAEGLLEAAEMARTVSENFAATNAPASEAAAALAGFSQALAEEAKKRSQRVFTPEEEG